MKEIIIALLTIIVNRYERTSSDHLYKKDVIRDLTDILDYVEDIQEGKLKPIQVTFHKNQDEELLRKRIRELEDCCENFVQVERNLLNKNEQLKSILAESLEFLPQDHRHVIKKVLEGK